MIKKIALTILIGIIGFYGYIEYEIHSVPTKRDLIEHFRVIRVSNFLGFHYKKGMSNDDFVYLRYKFRKIIKNRKLSDKELADLWNKMLNQPIKHINL